VPILYHSGVTRVKEKLARGYAQALRDLPTFLLICRHLPRSGDISRPAPASSLA